MLIVENCHWLTDTNQGKCQNLVCACVHTISFAIQCVHTLFQWVQSVVHVVILRWHMYFGLFLLGDINCLQNVKRTGEMRSRNCL